MAYSNFRSLSNISNQSTSPVIISGSGKLCNVIYYSVWTLKQDTNKLG